MRVACGEIDLVVFMGGELIAVEVKTRVGTRVDPIANFTPAKAARVRRAAVMLDPPAYRVDLVTVALGRTGAGVRWVPNVWLFT